MAVRSEKERAGNPTINLGDRIASHRMETGVGATRPFFFFSFFLSYIAPPVLEVVRSFLFIFSRRGGAKGEEHLYA